MGDTFLLGAGFSKAVCQTMPTMKELFQLLEPLIDTADGFNREAYDYASGNVETLLTYYAIPSPSDDPIEVLRKRRVTALLEQKIGSVLQCREGHMDWLAPSDSMKFGKKLVVKWMKQESHVLTANYDTLVEQLTGLLDDTQVSGLYPIPVVPSSAIMGHNPSGTSILERALTLYKLHGSVSWYKTHGESNSDPIYGYCGFSCGLHSREKLLGDKRRFIAPPVHDKSTLLSHESMRNLWRQAKCDALAPADNLYVIGYSLPETDMAMRISAVGSQATQTGVNMPAENTALRGRYRRESLPALPRNVGSLLRRRRHVRGSRRRVRQVCGRVHQRWWCPHDGSVVRLNMPQPS